MAILGLIDNFQGIHGTTERRTTRFDVEATVRGPIEKGFVGGVDYISLRKDFSLLLNRLNGQYLDDVVGRATI